MYIMKKALSSYRRELTQMKKHVRADHKSIPTKLRSDLSYSQKKTATKHILDSHKFDQRIDEELKKEREFAQLLSQKKTITMKLANSVVRYTTDLEKYRKELAIISKYTKDPIPPPSIDTEDYIFDIIP